MSNIPSGYSLGITSWENDADCYKTQVFHGLSEVDVRFLITIAKLFYSMNSPNRRGFGGGSWHYKSGKNRFYEDVYAAIDEVIEKFKDAGVSKNLWEQWNIDRPTEGYRDLIWEVVGMPEEEMYVVDGYIRVFESFEVHFYPSEVLEVTEKFK